MSKQGRRQPYTKEDVIAQIREVHDRSENGIRSADCPALLQTAIHLFGSWNNALVAADIPVVRKTWISAESMIVTLQEIVRQDGFISPQSDARVTRWAVRWFGSWEAALDAADIPKKQRRRGKVPPAGEPRRSVKEKLVEELQAILADLPPGQEPELPARLYRKVYYHFGSKEAGLAAAGFHVDLSRNEICARLRELANKNGHLTSRMVGKILYRQAKRHFGSWQGALNAAGIRTRNTSWSPDVAIAELRKMAARGKTSVLDAPPGLVNASRRLFGSWRAAQKAAGVPTRQWTRWTKETVVEEIRHRAAGQESIAISQVPSKLATAAVRIFGSWEEACTAAGVRPLRKRRPKNSGQERK